jgi:hypothetical protein
MIIEAKNGKTYTLPDSQAANLEIEREGLVFVLQDLSISLLSGKREAVFYSFAVADGERVFNDRHSVMDFPAEFTAFLESDTWAELLEWMVKGFLKKIEFTEQANGTHT